MTRALASGRVLAASLLATALGLAGTTLAIADTPGTATVDPVKIGTAGRPDIPWLDVTSGRIIQPNGGRTIEPSRGDGSDVLLHARGGYLLRASTGRIVFVSSSGKTRVVVRRTKLGLGTVSADGRRVVLHSYDGSNPRARTTLRVIRISDGHVVRTRSFRPDTFVVAAAGSGRVLLGQHTSGPRTGINGTTLWWDPRTNAVEVVVRHLPVAASTEARRVVVVNGRRDEVLDLSTKRVLWQTLAGRARPAETVLSFSPDNTKVVTAEGSSGGQSDGAPWDLARKLRVRDARSGRLLARITGNFAVETRAYLSGVAPVWESNTRLLLHATSDRVLPDPEGEYSWPHASVIRCSTVTARCLKVPIDIRDALLVRKSN